MIYFACKIDVADTNPEEEKIENRDEFSALPDFRSRILPVLGTIPSMFGMAIATFIILRLAEYPDFEPLPVKLREGLYVRLHRELLIRESKSFNEKYVWVEILKKKEKSDRFDLEYAHSIQETLLISLKRCGMGKVSFQALMISLR